MWGASLMCMLYGLFFRLFAVHPVSFRVFGETVSVNDRVYASLLCCAVFVARFAVKVFRKSNSFAILRELKMTKVPRGLAEAIVAAHSVRASELSRAASASAARRGCAVAPGDGPQRELTEAVQAALGACGGAEAEARRLLLSVIEELTDQQAVNLRRDSHAVADSMAQSWIANSSELVRLVLPYRVPFVIDPRRSIASALGGARFHDWCFALCRSRAFIAITIAIIPAGTALLIYVFSFHDYASTPALTAAAILFFLINAVQSFLLNTQILRIVMRSWDTYFSLFNLYMVAATGAFIFANPAHGRLWLGTQLIMSTFFFQDAAPPSRRARKRSGVALLCYASFHVYAVSCWSAGISPDSRRK